MPSYQHEDTESFLKDDTTLESKVVERNPVNLLKYVILFLFISGLFLASYASVSSQVSRTYFLTSEQRLAMANSGGLKYSSLSDGDVSTLFENFKSKYSVTYSSDEEEQQRLEIFKTFLTVVDERNDLEKSVGGNAIHGVTSYADRTIEEYKKRLGYVKSDDENVSTIGRVVTLEDYDLEKAQDSDSVNWFGVLTTSIKDQGYCGSCWAFSAASQIESDAIRAGYLTTSDTLSEQQIVSCDTEDDGCDGGATETAYYYVYEASGLVSAADYPYTSYYDRTGKCLSSLSEKTKLVTVSDYYTVDTEEAMAAHVKTVGPLSVCLDASSWASYTSGVVKSCGTTVDHCVQIVGINTASDPSYWIVRNSWGSSWGLDGLIYLEYGSNVCDITYDATYVEVAEA